jgi:hypothetical protein
MVKLRSARTPESGAFLVMDAAKSSARAAGKDIMDLSVGSSDCECQHAQCFKQESCYYLLAWRLLAAIAAQLDKQCHMRLATVEFSYDNL